MKPISAEGEKEEALRSARSSFVLILLDGRVNLAIGIVIYYRDQDDRIMIGL